MGGMEKEIKIIINMGPDMPEPCESKPFAGGQFDMPNERMHGGDGPPPMEDDECGEIGDPQDLMKQLLQSVSMMDTETDAAKSGDMDPKAAIDAVDNMTSRVLWGKQTGDNPESSYQNANYGEHTAAGLMMGNEANDKDADDVTKGTEKDGFQTKQEKDEPGDDESPDGGKGKSGRGFAGGRFDDDWNEPGDDEYRGQADNADEEKNASGKKAKPGRPW